jgi:phage-related minor tail protein
VDWLEDFFSKIVSWFDERAANIYNGIVAFINSLVEIWNGWMDALLHPAQAMPSVPALRFIVDWLSNLVDYTRLMYMLVDYVAYAAIVQQALLAQLAIVAVGLGFRAWLVIRRIVLVS